MEKTNNKLSATHHPTRKAIPPVISVHKCKASSEQLLMGVHDGILAYWISPTGKCVAVRTSHIDAVHTDNNFFDIDKDEILALHKFYGEKLGQEGQARNSIIKLLVRNGWTHIRFKPHMIMWMITSWVLDMPTTMKINNWFSAMMKSNLADRHTEFILHTISDDGTYSSKIGDNLDDE